MIVRTKGGFRSLSLDGRIHRGLTELREYLVLEVSDSDYRIVDDKGEPILYPKEFFVVVVDRIPPNWRFAEYDNGEYHLEPVSTGSPGFYEDYFGSDGDHLAKDVARKTVDGLLVSLLERAAADELAVISSSLRRLRCASRER